MPFLLSLTLVIVFEDEDFAEDGMVVSRDIITWELGESCVDVFVGDIIAVYVLENVRRIYHEGLKETGMNGIYEL